MTSFNTCPLYLMASIERYFIKKTWLPLGLISKNYSLILSSKFISKNRLLISGNAIIDYFSLIFCINVCVYLLLCLTKSAPEQMASFVSVFRVAAVLDVDTWSLTARAS